MDHQDRRQLAARARRPHEVAFDRSVAFGRRHGFVRRLQPLVVLRHLLRPRIVRLEAFVDGHRGDAADGVLAQPIDEIAAAHIAVLVLVKQIEDFLRIV